MGGLTLQWCSGRAARHSATRHSDRGGGGDAAGRHLGCIARMRGDRPFRLAADSAGPPPSVALWHGGFTRCHRARPGLGSHRLLAPAPAAGVVAGASWPRSSPWPCPWRPTPRWCHRDQAVPRHEGLCPLPVPRLRQADGHRRAHRLRGLAGRGAHQLGPRWLFFRLAIVVTLVLLLPDIYIWHQGQPAQGRAGAHGDAPRHRPGHLQPAGPPGAGAGDAPECGGRPHVRGGSAVVPASGARWCRRPPARRRSGARCPPPRWR